MRHPKHSFSALAKRYEAQNLEAAQRILADPKADPKAALVKWARRVMDRRERAGRGRVESLAGPRRIPWW